MSVYLQLAQAMFPHITKTPEDYEAQYPPRSLPDGARVTRIAPSPTGYLHLGTFFTSMVNRLTADASQGVFFFRLEDTDKKREVEGGADDILKGMKDFGLTIDEGFVAPGEIIGSYGPYQQSQRAEIYQAYVKLLVAENKAYPCFCTEEERQSARDAQEASKERTGYYGKYAVCRNLSPDEALQRITAGESYVVRLRSEGNEANRVKFDDMIKGTIEMPENDEDIVLLKSDGIPTYHFAHAVDDHLMRTTHVIRGDEWISSVPKHLQLFKTLGFKPPKYAHVSPIMVEENGNKRKLSKRKDPQAAMHFYAQQGYPALSVLEYLLTIANSDFEEWRRTNPTAPYNAFKFNLKKMSVSGALFDLDKLNDVSKTVIARMTATEVAQQVLHWADEYHPAFAALLRRDTAYTEGIFSIDRGNAKPRKDIARWSDVPDYVSYFFDELYDNALELPDNISPADAAAILRAYAAIYDPSEDKQAWFDSVKSICAPLGFSPDVKEYKKNPDNFKGHVGDISTVIRIAVTGRRMTPDLCSIMQQLGTDKVQERLNTAISVYENNI
ncbi:MAG: glutamate--tRNA ligase [Ruminococcaceae bacterium]|nr:glutamate--tRNA ligase [Oscillospiraceae bacterium]